MLPAFQKALILTGPTGAGKTSLAIDLACKLDAEIVSMDSMALYRELDIGTAKPTPKQRASVPHHLIDVLDPWESASVAWWLREAEKCVAEIENRGKRALIVGGTPLYLKALMFGLFDGPAADVAVRDRLALEAREKGTTALHERLARMDPASAARLHPNDLRRIIRALEVLELTGRPISDWQKQWETNETSRDHCSPASDSCIWLDLPRDVLYEQINRRVEEMFQTGLVSEVEGLMRLKKPLGMEASQALGYKEVIEHLKGLTSLNEAIEQVQTRTRHFAKRQITWFRHLPGCRRSTSELTESPWRSKMS